MATLLTMLLFFIIPPTPKYWASLYFLSLLAFLRSLLLLVSDHDRSVPRDRWKKRGICANECIILKSMSIWAQRKVATVAAVAAAVLDRAL